MYSEVRGGHDLIGSKTSMQKQACVVEGSEENGGKGHPSQADDSTWTSSLDVIFAVEGCLFETFHDDFTSSRGH